MNEQLNALAWNTALECWRELTISIMSEASGKSAPQPYTSPWNTLRRCQHRILRALQEAQEQVRRQDKARANNGQTTKG